MCKPISWIEYQNKNYYITNKDLNTKEGKELIKYIGNKDDIQGHGAVRHYYPELKGKGIEQEVNDFSTPKNFPPEIVKDLLKGNFSEVFTDFSDMLVMLNDEGRAEYEKIRQSALAEYEKIKQSAFWKVFKVKKYRAKGWK